MSFNDFERLHEQHIHLRRRIPSGEDQEEIAKDAISLLQEIKFASRHIVDDGQRARLESYAAYWGQFVFEIMDTYPDTSLLPPEVSAGNQHRTPHDLLPADLPDFVGREQEIDWLLNALVKNQPTRSSIIAISGMGGVGKSSLALHVAHRLGDLALDARVFVDMSCTSSGSLSSIEAMNKVIVALNPENSISEDQETAEHVYRHALEGARVLLVLDDAESSEQVRPLLDWRAPTTMAIVTSRRAITAPGIESITLGAMGTAEAWALLRNTLGRRPATEEELDELAQLCGRLPLALRVAGTYLAQNPHVSVARYIDNLADNIRRFQFLKIEDDARLDVSAVLSLSVRELAREKPELERRWRALSVFPSSFESMGVADVWMVERDAAEKDLGELRRRSMLFFDPSDGRWRLHDLMRDVAATEDDANEQWNLDEQLNDARTRHARHYCEVLMAADDLYLRGGDGVLVGLALYDLEQRNIVAGHAWAKARLENDGDAARLAADYANAGAYVLALRLHPRERIDWLETQREACVKLDDRAGEGSALGNLGIALADLGETRRAIEFYERHIEIAREIGDRRGEGYSLGNLGIAWANLGEMRRAIEFYEQSLAIAREIGDRRGEGYSLGNLSNAWAALGEPRRAIEAYEDRLVIAREIGDRMGEGNALGNLGNAWTALGEMQRAIEAYEQSLAIAHEIGDRMGAGNALGNLGGAWRHLGEPRRAIEHYEQHVAIAREIGDRRGEGNALGNLGSAWYSLGEPRRAIELYKQHLAIAREIGDRRGEGNALFNSGLALDALGERDEAVRRVRDALAIREAIGARHLVEKARAQLAEWGAADGRS